MHKPHAVSEEPSGKGTIAVDGASKPSIESLVQAVGQTGYTARPVAGNP